MGGRGVGGVEGGISLSGQCQIRTALNHPEAFCFGGGWVVRVII